MTNREYYKEQILDIACSGETIAFDKNLNEVVQCEGFSCDNCGFSNNGYGCRKILQEWANAEYVEQSVDWTKVEVDTKILVRDNEDREWKPRYFAKYEYGQVRTWCHGATSWSCEKGTTMSWKYAKLYKEE